MITWTVRGFTLMLLLLATATADAQAQRRIIDVHAHANPRGAEGSAEESASLEPGVVEAMAGQMLEQMNRYGVDVAVASGRHPDLLERLRAYAPDRFVVGVGPGLTLSHDSLEALYSNGRFGVLGEISPVYAGLPPTDPSVAGYFALAEAMDLPVGIHLAGVGAPPSVYPDFRIQLGNPALLEDVLAKHPKLRAYVMHAGYPFVAETIALLLRYPNVYADLALIDSRLPRTTFHSYLRALTDAGLANRLMYGSDTRYSAREEQWIEGGIDAIEEADFLTEEQKRGIFYDNAAVFFRLERP